MSEPASPSRRVLILDEPDQTGTLAAFFSKFEHGRAYDVETASTGPAAAAALRDGRPDLIVLDPQIRGLDGLQLLRQIRTVDRTIPVIVVTDRREARAVEEVLATGVFAYVPKPCEFVSFEHIVGLVPAGRARDASPAPPPAVRLAPPPRDPATSVETFPEAGPRSPARFARTTHHATTGSVAAVGPARVG